MADYTTDGYTAETIRKWETFLNSYGFEDNRYSITKVDDDCYTITVCNITPVEHVALENFELKVWI